MAPTTPLLKLVYIPSDSVDLSNILEWAGNIFSFLKPFFPSSFMDWAGNIFFFFKRKSVFHSVSYPGNKEAAMLTSGASACTAQTAGFQTSTFCLLPRTLCLGRGHLPRTTEEWRKETVAHTLWSSYASLVCCVVRVSSDVYFLACFSVNRVTSSSSFPWLTPNL